MHTYTNLHKQRDYDVTKPRIPVYKQIWKMHQNTVYWSNLRVAQKKGLTFNQSRSSAIILHNTLPAACIEKVVAMSSGEVLFFKMYESPRSPRKVVLKPAGHEGRANTTSMKREHPTPIPPITGRLVAVKSIIGFKDYNTLQLNMKTMHAKG